MGLEWHSTHQCTSPIEPVVGFIGWMKLCFFTHCPLFSSCLAQTYFLSCFFLFLIVSSFPLLFFSFFFFLVALLFLLTPLPLFFHCYFFFFFSLPFSLFLLAIFSFFFPLLFFSFLFFFCYFCHLSSCVLGLSNWRKKKGFEKCMWLEL